MASLLNPFLIRTGLLYDVAAPTIPEPSFIRADLKFSTVLQNVIIPIALFMVLAFFLKHRYNKKRDRINAMTAANNLNTYVPSEETGSDVFY